MVDVFLPESWGFWVPLDSIMNPHNFAVVGDWWVLEVFGPPFSVCFVYEEL